MMDASLKQQESCQSVCGCSSSFVLDKNITEFVNVTLNGNAVKAPKGITVIQLCELEGIEIPRFCYHDRLKIAGNCRMCLVEIQPGPPKPQASCAMNVAEGMVINTETEMVKKARAGVMEFLLQNHPLDCPVCDQGGECDLQDQAYLYGRGESRFDADKRAVTDKDMGPVIQTQMTRCIHCMRCVRFIDEIAGTNELGAFNRGNDVEVTTYLNTAITSELSGNVIDLCPVGALTSKPYRFRARSWELKKTYSIDVMDAVGSNIRVDSKGNEVLRILPAVNEDINEEWISDKTRFAYDGLKMQRLGFFYAKQEGKLNKISKYEAFSKVKTIIDNLSDSQSQIAAIAGDLADCETMLALKKLSSQIGFNKVTCLQDGAKINSSSRANYICGTGIAGIEESDLVLIIGSNPRSEAPILNARIRKASLQNKAKIYLLGEECNLNYNFTHLGTQKSILDDILSGNHDICKAIKNAKKPCLILGQSALTAEDGLEIHNKAMQLANSQMQRDGWRPFNLLHKAAARVGGLDAALSGDVHLDYTADKIIQACTEGKVKLLILIGADELDFDKISHLKDLTIIYIGSHGDRAVKYANIIMPSCAYTEKQAHYTNTAGTLQTTLKAVAKPEEAMDDAELICELSKCFTTTFVPFIDSASLYEEVKQLTKQRAAEHELHFSVSTAKLSGNFTLPKANFYQTCYISRASKTMALCLAAASSNK